MADTQVHTLLVEELALLRNQKHVTHELAHCNSTSHGAICLLVMPQISRQKILSLHVADNKSPTESKKGITDEMTEKWHDLIIYSCLVLYILLQLYNRLSI